MNTMVLEQLVQKLQMLPPQRVAEVEDFIDFLRLREQSEAATQAAMQAAEPVLESVWDNADDADYDRL